MADEKEKEQTQPDKSPTEMEVANILNAFFNEEVGNRVTINNMQSLTFRIQAAFNKHKVPK